MSVTIHDVARRAGVSPSTVSRVLNGTSPVREDKRQLVLEAAEALDYTPHPAALSLLSKRTGGLGVLLPFVGGDFFAELLSGLDEAAQELGLFLTISTSHRRHDEFRRAIHALDRRVDGLIVMAPDLDPGEAATILRTDTPVVFLNTDTQGLAADTFNFDNVGGMRALTRHLLDLGHERVAFVAGPAASDAAERLQGYRDVMREAGLDVRVVEGGYTRQAGFAAASALLADGPLPSALVCANDYCAFGAMSALHQAGIDIPGEVAVGGFDGVASAQYAVPPLTTVRVPIREIGDRAVRRLAARLDGQVAADELVRTVVPVELVARASTEGARASRPAG